MMSDKIIEQAVLWTFVLIILLVAASLSSYRCHARWQGSGMDTDWGLFRGCRLMVEPQKWIPEDRYRQVPE